MKKKYGVKVTGLALCVLLCLASTSEPLRFLSALPDTIYMDGDAAKQELAAAPLPLSYEAEAYPVQGSTDERLGQKENEGGRLRVMLFHAIPLREIELQYRDRPRVIPGGQAIGVTLYLPGALVVGLGAFLSGDGRMVSPAQDAGIRAGDMVLEINGIEVENAAHLSALCAQSPEEALRIKVQREEAQRELQVEPVQAAEDGEWKLGMWVRDSTAGIGTLSFYDMRNLRFGALGHPVVDVDTGSLLAIEDGGVSEARVIGVSSGMRGVPGELHGAFRGMEAQRIGTVEKNTGYGIFGTLEKAPASLLYPEGIPIAFAGEVRPGAAQILSTVDESGVRAFSCEIVRTFSSPNSNGKDMVIRIDDAALLSITGGIVQGMSGSPIIQDGKLVGAVTHVLVNDPTRGYGIFIENMLEASA